MSERELRKGIACHLCPEEALCGLCDGARKALSEPPDVVKVAKVLRGHKVVPPKSRAEIHYVQGWEDAVQATADNLERMFGFRLTADGWEWVEEGE